jgi:hypothetical protein
MERRSIRLLIGGNFHREKPVTRAVILVKRRVTTSYNNLQPSATCLSLISAFT